MGGISIWQILILLIIVAIPFLLFGPIAKKAGFSKWWSLLMIIPFINLIVLWIFAFIKWPAEDLNV